MQHEGDFEATNRKIRELDLDVKAFTIGCESVRAQGQSREGHRHTSAWAEVLKLYQGPGPRSKAVCVVCVMCDVCSGCGGVRCHLVQLRPTRQEQRVRAQQRQVSKFSSFWRCVFFFYMLYFSFYNASIGTLYTWILPWNLDGLHVLGRG